MTSAGYRVRWQAADEGKTAREGERVIPGLEIAKGWAKPRPPSRRKLAPEEIQKNGGNERDSDQRQYDGFFRRKHNGDRKHQNTQKAENGHASYRSPYVPSPYLTAHPQDRRPRLGYRHDRAVEARLLLRMDPVSGRREPRKSWLQNGQFYPCLWHRKGLPFHRRL